MASSSAFPPRRGHDLLRAFGHGGRRDDGEARCLEDLLPSSTLVPSSRTTSGTLRPSSFAAATTPLAMMSHFMMPPKMFTKMPFTWSAPRMIRNAVFTCSCEAPPPTSRKFAGEPP
jgi:hypothetical protein